MDSSDGVRLPDSKARGFADPNGCLKTQTMCSVGPPANLHARVPAESLDRWTQMSLGNSRSVQNADLRTTTLSCSRFDFTFGPESVQNQPCSSQRIQLNGIVPQTSMNGICHPDFLHYRSNSFSKTDENAVKVVNSSFPFFPITPERDNKSTTGGINEGAWQNVLTSMHNGSEHICLDQGVLRPVNAARAEISLQHMNQQKAQLANIEGANSTYVGLSLQTVDREKRQVINLDGVDFSNKVKCQLSPVTPDHCKNKQDIAVADNICLGNANEDQEGRQQNDNCQTDKEHVQECVSNRAPDHFPCSDTSQQHNSVQGLATPLPKPKNKKHRPKVIKEGKSARKPRQTTPVQGTGFDKPAQRKRSARKKESGSRETPSDERNNTGRPGKTPRKSAKRSLNFDSETQAKDKINVTSSSAQSEVEVHGNTSNNSSSNAKSTLETSEGKKICSSIEITTDMCRSGGQVSYEHNSLQQNPIPSVYASRRRIIRENIKALARESNSLETKIRCDSKVSSGVQASDSHTPQGGNQKGVKRDLTSRAGDADLFHVNLIPGNFCGQMYNKVNENHCNTANEHCFIPEACKKRRTENRHNKFAPTAPTTPLAKGGKSVKELREQVSCFSDTQLFMAREKLRASGHMLRFGQTERLPVHTSPVQNISFKFDSTATTMVNSHFTFAPRTPQSGEQRQGFRGMEALIETENVKVPRKRRTMDRKNSKPNEIHNSSVSSEATMHPSNAIEFIVQKLEQLNLDGITQGFAPENLQNNALVLYNRGGVMVPYESLFTALKKRRPRAKVDLDSETNRVWMLLMGKDCGSCPEGTEIDKEKWWEEERKVFQGRADSFIARMHLIQGDRRFSKWKGSVVDSVVGVFLTQNVSDHLSSSAFMSLVSRYPNHFGVDRSEADLTNTSILTESQPEYLQCSHPIKQKGGELEQQEISEDSLAYHEVIDVEQDGNNTSGCTNGTASHGHGVDPGMVTEGTKPIDAEDLRLMESTFSSQNSVISSQNSSESLVQVSEQTGLSSDSNSVEYAKRGNGWDNFKNLTSFTELLQMAGTYRLHDYNSLESGKMIQSGYSGSVTRHSERESTENEFQKCNDIGCLEVKHVDSPYSSSCLSHKQHDVVVVSDVPSVVTNLDKNSQNGFEMADKIESVLESQSLSTNSRGKSIAEIKNPCTADQPLQKNTTGYTEQLNSGSMCSCSFTSDHPQLIPSPKVVTFRQSNSCNYSYIQWDASTTSRKEVQASSGRDAEHGNHQKKDSGIQVMGKQNENERSTLNLNHEVQESHANSPNGPTVSDVTEFSSTGQKERFPQSAAELSFNDEKAQPVTVHDATTPKKKKTEKKPKDSFDWDTLRKEVLRSKEKKERTFETMDSIDWEAVRRAGASAIADTIRERGMNNVLAGRIKDFLDRLVNDHGSIDLEWLRDVPPDQVKDYLLSIRGLGLKSVECVRLLTLHHLAFPVDTNVGRICVRLGWVPLQPLPESVQLHLLELYPMLETIQKYLWPRLCELDQRTLYELHYQMITFGKVFCTKSKPNCNACPMRGECKHFASAYASARLSLPGPEEKGLVTSNISAAGGYNREPSLSQMPLPQLEGCLEKGPKTSNISAAGEHNHEPSLDMMPLPQLEGCLEPQAPIVKSCEPLIEEPSTPEPEVVETSENAIEDAFYEDPDEIPVIKLNIEQFTQNLQNILQTNNDLQEGDMSKALVALKPETASIPQPKLKNISRLRTEHQVYELPDAHPLLERLEEREPDDPCPYLLAIWTPGETAQSMESPETSCNSQGAGKLCDSMTCFACNSIREARAQKVRGTLLIPCRTAMRGSFPLNGTYFQVNEVFADHSSSLSPIDVPREWLWNLPRRTVYFGTSVPTIFRGLTTEGIQHCFWRGFVCVRGFDQRTRAPRPLLARLHFPASKLPKNKNATTKEAK